LLEAVREENQKIRNPRFWTLKIYKKLRGRKNFVISYTDKKKIEFSSYIWKFRVEQLHSHIITNGLLISGEIFAHFLIY
jgi:hypothetical protein